MKTLNRSGVALLLVAAGGLAVGAPQSKAALTTLTATDNSTIKPAGPRAGTSNQTYFNVEGNSNGTNASFGVAEFTGPGGGGFTSLNGVTLSLTESNASFTNAGPLAFYLTRDNATNIDNTGSPTTPNYQSASAPSGIGSQFSPNDLIGAGTFNTTGNVNSGTVDTYALTGLSASDTAYILDQLNTGGKIRVIVAPNDTGTTGNVAATFAGFTNATFKGPQLTVDAVPEPASAGMMAVGGLVLMLRRRRK